MFYIYADGKSIYQPMDNSLSLFSPKLTLEMGKAGSLTFQIPPSNKYYNALSQLVTVVTVEMDDTEIFRGRVLTNNMAFNKVRTIYCEGDLAYLVDSVQKGAKYEGKAHDLFRSIIAAHNSRVEASKRFIVGGITVENRDVLLAGKSDEIQDVETGKFDYKQIAINSIADEWMTSFDYIESTLIGYIGGYLRTRRQNGNTYIDYLSDYGTTAVQEIEFGKNLLDLTEEVSAEDVFTVLIPLGDENLTIESVNNGSDELVDAEAVARYGRIVKTHVFDSVTNASTLLENGQRYLSSHVNVPITITAKAVDMHLVDPNASAIFVGDQVRVSSIPHGMLDLLTCTKIEYDMENPANNTYTFGTPKQSLTERYRKDQKKSESSSGGSAGGAAGETASEEAQEKLKEFFDAWINVNPEAGHIDLGALYEKYNNDKTILKNQVGINLDAPSGQINIKNLREELDEATDKITKQAARIDLINNETVARIDLVASHVTQLEKVELGHYAALVVRADANESAIEAKADKIVLDGVYERLENGEEKQQNLETVLKETCGISIDTTNSQYNVNIATLKRIVDAQGETIGSQGTTISSLTNSLQSQITLEAKHNKDNVESIASIRVTANNNASKIEAKADRFTVESLRTQLTATQSELTDTKNVLTQTCGISMDATGRNSNIKITTLKQTVDAQGQTIQSNSTNISSLSNSLQSQITLEAKHNKDNVESIASIRVTANNNASNIRLKANKTYVDSEILAVTGKITAAEAEISTLKTDMANVETLIANKVNAITLSSLIAKATIINASVAITSGISVTAPIINASTAMGVGGKAVATQEYVNGKVSGFATESWVEGKGYLTGIPSTCNASVGFYAPYIRATSGMSLNGKAVATQEWVTSQLASYAKSDHTHSGYASSDHSHGWSSITGKPSNFKPTNHRHSISFSIANGHTHKTTVNGTQYTSTGVSVNATHSVSSNTGYYPG